MQRRLIEISKADVREQHVPRHRAEHVRAAGSELALPLDADGRTKWAGVEQDEWRTDVVVGDGACRNRVARSVDVEIRGGGAEARLLVADAEAGRAVRAERTGLIAERIQTLHRQSVNLRAHIFDRVVIAKATERIVVVADMHSETVGRSSRFELLQVVPKQVVLPAERDRTELVRRQADEGLPPEHAATLLERAAGDIEAVFELRDRRVAAPQIFSDFQAPARVLHRTRQHLDVRVSFLRTDVFDSNRHQPVERDAALRGGELAEQDAGCGGDDLFHCASP